MFEKATPRDSALLCFTLIARHFHQDMAMGGLIHRHALTGEDLSTAELTHIVEEAGFKARVVHLSFDDLFGLGQAFPLLARTPGNKHFILSGVRGDALTGQAAIIDPSSGNLGFVFLGREELAKVWDGEALLLKRVCGTSSEARSFSLRWFIPEMLRQGKLFRDVALLTVVLNILNLAFPMYFMVIMDKVLGQNGLATLNTATLALVAVFVFSAVFEHLQSILLDYASNRLDLRLGKTLFHHLLALPIDYFDRTSSGALLNDLQQSDKIRAFLTGKLLMTVLNCSMIIIVVPILFYFSWVLASITLAFALLIAAVIGLVLRPIRSRLRVLYQEESRKQSHLVETIRGMATIKALALEGVRIKTWDGQSTLAAETGLSVRNLSISVNAVIQLLENLMKITALFVAVYLVMDKSISIGAVVAINILSGMVVAPLVQIVALINEFQEVGISVDMLGRILDRPGERPPAARGLIRPISGLISFENVTFRYAPGATPALDNVSLTIPAGTMIGIVGRSGSGKSTLARLIQSLYPVQEGLIKIDGQDIREIDLAHLRKNIGVVLQDNFLFSGTVRQNISLTNPQAPPEEIVLAARMAGAEEFIARLPKGYDTFLHENGVNLSGGQRQRLAIARALLSRPRILMLDEATSALDAESESIVQTNLSVIAKGRTVIMISHRLSMLLDCHKIVVLDEGRIIGEGPHAQLLESCALYRDLWTKQHPEA